MRLYFYALGSGQDLLLLLQVSADDHGHVDWIFLEAILGMNQMATAVTYSSDLRGDHATARNLTCRFLLILRMLCCSRKLFSRAKRLCWSSS